MYWGHCRYMYTQVKRNNLKRQCTRDIAGTCTLYTQAKRKNLKRQCTLDIAGICTQLETTEFLQWHCCRYTQPEMKESLTTRQFVLWTLKVHTNRNDRTSNDSTIVSLSYKITHAIKKSSSDLFDNRIFALSCAKCNSTADSILYLYVLMHYAVSQFFQIWKNSVLYHKV